MNAVLFINLLWVGANLQTGVLAEFQRKLQDGQILRTSLEISEKSAETRQTTVHTAELWLAADGYRLETGDRTYLVKGNESRVFEKTENRLIISEYVQEDDDFAPARYLSGIPEGYKAQEKKSGASVSVVFKTTDKALTFKDVTTVFSAAGLPAKLHANDAWGGSITIQFKNAAFSSAGDWSQLKTPETAEIIDLRQ